MIHKKFSFEPDQITGFLYSKSAQIFTVKLKNNAVIHYQSENPADFLKWLEENASKAKAAIF